MRPALKVITAGLHTTVQDAGRSGYQAIGLPASGPLDRVSFRLANALVGNPPGAPSLEMLLQGPTCEVLVESMRIALSGWGGSIDVLAPHPRSIPAGASVRLTRGEIFRIGSVGESPCAYLAIEGGIVVPPVLGSASTYVRGAIGGFEGRRLRKNDVVGCAQETAEDRRERTLARPPALGLDQPIRVVRGPQIDYFTDAGIHTFLTSEYTVSPQADRMGFRLEGPAVAHARGHDIVSDGVVPGAIQVPGSGLPIVLMVDNQTTGGYPKIAAAISADIPILARRRPGRRLRFVAVEVSAAEHAAREQETALCEEEHRLANGDSSV